MIRIQEMIHAGASVSKVARVLGIDRKTVRKYRAVSVEDYSQLQQRHSSRVKEIEAYKNALEEIIAAIEEECRINAQAIFDRLKPLGYNGSTRTVRRYVKAYRKEVGKKRIYQPFETEPGHQALVDLGEKRGVSITGEKRAFHFIVMVLGHSRYKYCEWFLQSPTTEDFIRFHNQAFRMFGGVPHEMVYDQTCWHRFK